MNFNADRPFSITGFDQELRENILPFWMSHPLDKHRGGFHGALSSSNEVLIGVERGSILCSRILWTFSKAFHHYREQPLLEVAQWAYRDLLHRFWDDQYGGVYWSTDDHGQPLQDRKHTYAQAFAIYGLTAFFEISDDRHALELSKNLFHLIDTHTFDDKNGGNLECRSREWTPLEDMRLSDKDLNSSKSMNTLLHLTEAYSALARVWKDARLTNRLEGLIDLFQKRIIDLQSGHQLLFFTDQWESLSNHISYGHDIETSWLLLEAASALGDEKWIRKAENACVTMAQTVYDEALLEDGSILYEASPDGFKDLTKQWWAHAEAVVGFYNAYQQTGQPLFLNASKKVWGYIQDHFIDREGGDWFKALDSNGYPDLTHNKVGPWDCPYHHARMCLEMIHRSEKTKRFEMPGQA